MVVTYSNCTSKNQALQMVKEKIIAGILAKFQVKADITDNGNDQLKAKGRGFELIAHFDDAQMDISLKLSLLLRPLKSKIEHVLLKEIKKIA